MLKATMAATTSTCLRISTEMTRLTSRIRTPNKSNRHSSQLISERAWTHSPVTRSHEARRPYKKRERR